MGEEFDRKLSPDQEYEYAMKHRDMCQDGVNLCVRRIAELSDEFTRLEVQIAVVLFAFSGLFLNYFNTSSKLFPPEQAFLLKLTFVIGVISLILSLILGLLHLKRKEQFWEEGLNQKNTRYHKWDSVVRKECSYTEGRAYQEGTKRGGVNIISTPVWSWILQTIFLALSLSLLLVLLIVFVFHM